MPQATRAALGFRASRCSVLSALSQPWEQDRACADLRGLRHMRAPGPSSAPLLFAPLNRALSRGVAQKPAGAAENVHVFRFLSGPPLWCLVLKPHSASECTALVHARGADSLGRQLFRSLELVYIRSKGEGNFKILVLAFLRCSLAQDLIDLQRNRYMDISGLDIRSLGVCETAGDSALGAGGRQPLAKSWVK